MAAVTRWAVAVLLAVGFAVSPVGVSQAAPGELTADGAVGMEQIATCLRSNPNLAALLVIDESGSLQDTDPDNLRAEILADLVSSLSNLSGQETASGPRQVEFAVNTFAQESRTLLPWTTLTPQNAPDISTSLESQIPALNQGQATDYESALTAAASTMAEGVAKLSAEVAPCQIVIWFTDGVLVIGDDQMNAASADRLCAPGGPVDALRAAGVHLLSVLLFDRSELDLYVPEDQEKLKRGIPLLQSTAEGSGGSGQYAVECGQQPIPVSYARGAFFEGSIDALASQFAQAIALGSGGTPVTGLSGSPLTLSIDPGITSFRLVGLAPQGFALTDPDGASVSIEPGTTSAPLSGTEISVVWTGPTFTADVPVSTGGTGDWVLERPSMSDAVGLFLFSDLRLEITPVQLVADEPATITGQVVGPDGQPADLSSFSSVDLKVTQIVDEEIVEDPTPFTLDSASGSFSGTFTPLTTSLVVQFDITLDLVTQSGYLLAPLTTTFVRDVKLPGAYPSLSPPELRFAALQNTGEQSTVDIVATGSADGQTKVCVREVNLGPGLPEAEVVVTAGSSSNCVDIAPGATIAIPVTAQLGSAVADGGQVSGEVVLVVENAPTDDLPARERPLTIPFTVQVVAVGPVLWVPFVLTVLGILIPLMILYFLNWRAARLDLEGVMMARIPVSIPRGGGGRLSRTDASESDLITADDVRFVAAPRTSRSWKPGQEELRAQMSWNPFGSVSARVIVPEGSYVVSNQDPMTTSDGRRAGIGLQPNMTAYIIADENQVTQSQTPTPSSTGSSWDLDGESGTGNAANSGGSDRQGILVAFIQTDALIEGIPLLRSKISEIQWGEKLDDLARIRQTKPEPIVEPVESDLSDSSSTGGWGLDAGTADGNDQQDRNDTNGKDDGGGTGGRFSL